jgi:hypothetical protein
MRIFLPFLLLLAACLEQSGLQCPPNTNLIGQYALKLTANHDAGECIAQTDAGPVPLALDDAGVLSSSLCAGTWSDGGIQLNLVVPGKGGPRTSDLLPDGGFHFLSPPVPGQPQTACVCPVDIAETIDGYLLTGGPFALRPDGGLPLVTGVSGTLTDRFTAAGTGCICTFPCSASFSISGVPF